MEEPKTCKFTSGKSTVEWTMSNVYVEAENGAKLPIYFELVEQNLWGVNGIFPFGLQKDKQVENKLEGYQICYPMTSLKTMGKPTKEERKTQRVFDKVTAITVSFLKKFG